jgi:hypothetical protein
MSIVKSAGNIPREILTMAGVATFCAVFKDCDWMRLVCVNLCHHGFRGIPEKKMRGVRGVRDMLRLVKYFMLGTPHFPNIHT